MKTDPEGPENEPHTTTTNLTENLKDTVIASEESNRADRSAPKPLNPTPAVTPETGLKLNPAQLVLLAPRLRSFVTSDNPSWPEIVDAADWLRGELGVSRPLWAEACRLMGREYAAVAIAIVSTKSPGHFLRCAGGHFAGMVPPLTTCRRPDWLVMRSRSLLWPQHVPRRLRDRGGRVGTPRGAHM